MGYASRQNKTESERAVLVVCPTQQINLEFSAFAARTANGLEIMQKFIDKSCELDEDAPDFEAKMSPIVSELVFNLIANYPNPNHLETDIETLKQVKILTK